MNKDFQQGKIYMIVNLITGLVYIGSTVKPLKNRWQIHYCSINITVKKNRPLYKAIAECGKHNFAVFILEKYPCECQEQLTMRETYWQDIFDSRNPSLGYNVFRAYSSLETQKETDKQYNITFRARNPDYQKQWRSSKGEEYKQQNTDKMRNWRENNKEHYNKYMRDWRNKSAKKKIYSIIIKAMSAYPKLLGINNSVCC
jgi:group I intron endonuclease